MNPPCLQPESHNERCTGFRTEERALIILGIKLFNRERTDYIWRNVCRVRLQQYKCEVVRWNYHLTKTTIILEFTPNEFFEFADKRSQS